MASVSAVRTFTLAALTLLLAGASLPVPGEASRDALRICADPNNMPFSNKQQEGFENRIAELFAKELGLSTRYTWYPQRMGFVRNTLRAKDDDEPSRYKCDLVLGVSPNFEMGLATRPYYHSSYAMVFVKGQGLDGVHSQEDLLALPPERLAKLRFGTFSNTPAVDWLLRHGLIRQAQFLQIQTGDPDYYAGKLVQETLASGEVDVAMLWGPIAGYFAERSTDKPMTVITMKSEPGIVFDFDISMGVRFGEGTWRKEVERLIEKKHQDIDAILAAYHVPLLPVTATAPEEDD